MTLFHHLFPEISSAEASVVQVPPNTWGVAPIAYIPLDFYCTEPNCDCRCVHLEFLAYTEGEVAGPRQSGRLRYGWERTLYYKKFARHAPAPGDWQRLAGVSLFFADPTDFS